MEQLHDGHSETLFTIQTQVTSWWHAGSNKKKQMHYIKLMRNKVTVIENTPIKVMFECLIKIPPPLVPTEPSPILNPKFIHFFFIWRQTAFYFKHSHRITDNNISQNPKLNKIAAIPRKHINHWLSSKERKK